jgi:hypothetical protein
VGTGKGRHRESGGERGGVGKVQASVVENEQGRGHLSETEGAQTCWSEGKDGRCGGVRDRGVDAGGKSKARRKHGWHRPGSCGQIEQQWRRLGQRVVVGGSCTNDGVGK